MMPVEQAMVVDFLEWLRQKKPGVHSLIALDVAAFMALVDEHEISAGRQPPQDGQRENWAGVHWAVREIDRLQDAAPQAIWYSHLLIDWKELLATGIEVRKGAHPAARHRDLLEAHLSVPNRMFILYTSEDKVLSTYLIEHWNALDGLSGENCHIFHSMWQLQGQEDAYTYLGVLSHIPGVKEIEVKELPVFVLWSDHAHLRVKMRGFADSPERLRELFRHVFGRLSRIRGPIRPADVTRLEREIKAMLEPQDRNHSSALQFLGPLMWALPLVIIFPLMTYTLSTGGISGSIVVFFFVLLLYGLLCVVALRAQGKIKNQDFMEALKLVYSTSLVGLKELAAKVKG